MKRILLFAIAISLTSIASAFWNSWCNNIPRSLHGCQTCSAPMGTSYHVCPYNKDCCWKHNTEANNSKYGCTTDYYVSPNNFKAECLKIMGATPDQYHGVIGTGSATGGDRGGEKGNSGTPKNTPKTTTPVKTNVAPVKVTTPAKTAASVKTTVAQKATTGKQVSK